MSENPNDEGGRKPFRKPGDRPFRSGGFRSEDRGGDRSFRPYGDGGERTFRDRGDRPRGDRPFGDRPPPRGDRPFGDRPRGDRPFGDRPPPRGDRPYGDRPRGDRPFGDRPPPRGDRPYGDRPRGDRPFGDRPPRGDRPFGDRPRGDRPFGDRPPRGDRPFGDRPRGDRPFGDRPPRGDRPFGDRPRGDRPFGDRPRGDRPSRDFQDRPRFAQTPREYPKREPSQEELEDKRILAAEAAMEEEDTASETVGEEGAAAEAESNEQAPTNPEAPSESRAVASGQQHFDNPPWFRKLTFLTTDKGRDREGRFLAEGSRCVAEMVEFHPDIVDGIYWRQGSDVQELLTQAQAKGLRTHDLEPELFDQLSSTVTSQGILAVCRSASNKPSYDTAHFLTLVDAIQDPGNLGALFRTSLGFGLDGMLIGKGSVDPFNPKVVRGSSGTFLRQPFEIGVDLAERIDFLRRKGFTVIGTSSHAKQTLDQIPGHRLRKVAILVGNEGAGAEEKLMGMADELVKIQTNSGLESLNVAVAHGVLAYQVSAMQK